MVDDFTPPSLHALISPEFRKAIVSALVDRMAGAGRVLGFSSKELGGAPEPLFRGILVWNFVLSALDDIAVSYPDLGLSVERRGRLRIFRCGGLTFLPYSIQKFTETHWGPMALTAQDKKYVARLFREHRQEKLRFDDAPLEPLPAILAHDTIVTQNDDGSPTIRLESVHFAYPAYANITDAIGVNLGSGAVQVYPAPKISVPTEPERTFEPGSVKLRIVKDQEELSEPEEP